MTKVTLEFELPEDQAALHLALRAGKWHSVVYELAEYLRSRVKYGDGPENPIYQEISDRLWTELEERGLDPYATDQG